MAEAGFYILTGKIKLSVVSRQGKEAVVAIPEPGAFWGEGCLARQLAYMAAATAMEDSNFVRIDKKVMIRLLHDNPILSEWFLEHLLSRNK